MQHDDASDGIALQDRTAQPALAAGGGVSAAAAARHILLGVVRLPPHAPAAEAQLVRHPLDHEHP